MIYRRAMRCVAAMALISVVGCFQELSRAGQVAHVGIDLARVDRVAGQAVELGALDLGVARGFVHEDEFALCIGLAQWFARFDGGLGGLGAGAIALAEAPHRRHRVGAQDGADLAALRDRGGQHRLFRDLDAALSKREQGRGLTSSNWGHPLASHCLVVGVPLNGRLRRVCYGLSSGWMMRCP